MKRNRKLFIISLIILFLLFPEYYSPVGRIGGDAVFCVLLIIHHSLTQILRKKGFIFLQKKVLSDCWPMIALFFYYVFIVLYWPFMSYRYQLSMTVWRSPLGIGRIALFTIAGYAMGITLKKEELEYFLKWLIRIGLLVIIFGLLQIYTEFAREITIKYYTASFANIEELAHSLRYRPRAAFKIVFAFAFFCIFYFSLVYSEFLIKTSSLHAYALMLLAIVAELYSQTKGGVLGLLLVLLYISKFWKFNLKYILISIVSFIVVSWLLLRFGDVLFARLQFITDFLSLNISSGVQSFQENPNVTMRLEVIKLQQKVFFSAPLFGNIYDYSTKVVWSDNLYFTALASSGIVGLSLFGLCFWKLFRVRILIKKARLTDDTSLYVFADTLKMAVIGGLAMGVTWNVFITNRMSNLLFFLYGLLCGYIVYHKSLMRAQSPNPSEHKVNHYAALYNIS